MKYKKTLMLAIFLVGICLVLYPIVSKRYYEAHLNDVVESFNGGFEKDLPKSAIDADVFATIEIPKLNLHLPIYYGASNDILAKGIGLIENPQESIGGMNTHSVLAGHSGMASKEFFTNIHKLDSGDIFKINRLDEQLNYRVIDNRKIKVTETEYLKVQKGRDLVTLLTCPPFDSKNYRIIVIGERVNNPPD
ncbi:class C sortase [Amphibacillus sp. MSJ-3]|uniref:class C sortase n=1 Tax=Amphibacillus sp. MSJ-3 TaxID=2841505 RepID=UPI001C0EA925|nr:class C sortase [Amphibacillus sp. MSJ-3]MBU5594323.1 class C sortase [Amphibacillus sp. MSJ-3]